MSPKKKVVNNADGFGDATAPEHRGRTSELTNDQLHDRRDQLVQAFEGMWGDIGWELQACKKPDDLALVLKPLTETFVSNLIEVFCRPAGQSGSAIDLQALRRERKSITEKVRNGEQAKYRAQEQLQRVEAALVQFSGSQRDVIILEREKWSEEAKRTAEEARRVLDAERELGSRLQQQEASLARKELFHFLKSRRYSIEPLTLANAVAGLPYMGWRQSMKRCIAVPRYGLTQNAAVDSLAYQVFKSICRLCSAANKRTEDTLVSSFREGIPILPDKDRLPRAELAKTWFYLERAIREAYRASTHPKKLPFEIQKRYLRQICSKSQVDMILAEHSRIELKTEKRRRKGRNS